MDPLFSEIMEVPVVSTGYLPRAELDVLEDLAKQLTNGDTNTGWPIMMPQSDGAGWIFWVGSDDLPAYINKHHLPEHLAALMIAARAHGYQWLRLDADGPEIHDPAFPWFGD